MSAYDPHMNDKHQPVSRVVRRKAKPEHETAYEALVKCMVDASSHFPGYLSATVFPPHSEANKGEYQIVQRFATHEDLTRWDEFDERAMLHERMHSVTENALAYSLVAGLEV